MERKIGEIFEYNGEWYQCVEGKTICSECDLRNIICQRDTNINNPFKGCSGNYRTDKTNVIFKKLEKVGEPYKYNPRIDILFQCYKLQNTDYTINCNGLVVIRYYDGTIGIEIKQNKEDMEEKKLKPFDLQKAREGKSVCTRDGRKARIICFDRKHIYEGQDYSIVALINEGSYSETVCSYTKDGLHTPGRIDNNDLMMPSEKKEGWAKVRKDINLYDTKEEADRKMIENDEYVTAICWEE